MTSNSSPQKARGTANSFVIVCSSGITAFSTADVASPEVSTDPMQPCRGRAQFHPEFQGHTGFNHLMLEVARMDDLGRLIDLLDEYDTDVMHPLDATPPT